MDDLASPPPIFIVGCGRSGTTMFRLMLDHHPDLAIPGESHFIPKLWRQRRRFETDGRLDVLALARGAMDTDQFRRWGVPEEQVLERIAGRTDIPFGEVIESLFLAYAGSRGKSRWGDKTPQYVRSMPLLAAMFPRARFVHIVRDGRDVALSYIAVRFGPSNIWQAAVQWRDDAGVGHRDGRTLGPMRYLEVRYEDLIADPRAVLERVGAFAALPFAGSMLEYHLDARDRLQARADRTTHHEASTMAPTTGLRDWRVEMSDQDVMAFESIAGPLLAGFGYEVRYANASAMQRARGSLRARQVVIGKAVRRQLGMTGPPATGG